MNTFLSTLAIGSVADIQTSVTSASPTHVPLYVGAIIYRG